MKMMLLLVAASYQLLLLPSLTQRFTPRHLRQLLAAKRLLRLVLVLAATLMLRAMPELLQP
jgi:hypothetical protein